MKESKSMLFPLSIALLSWSVRFAENQLPEEACYGRPD